MKGRMMRSWAATMLLAGAWLFGLGYYYPPQPWWFLALIAPAALLLLNQGNSFPKEERQGEASLGWRKSAALLLLLPPAWLAAWPYNMPFLLSALGLAFFMATNGRAKAVGRALLFSGLVLLFELAALLAYEAMTMRSHELPSLLAEMAARALQVVGVAAVYDGMNLVFPTLRQAHRLAPTWELFLDPATLMFFFGAAAMCALAISTFGGTVFSAKGWRAWLSALRALAAIVIVWLPIRAVLLISLYIHRVVIADPERPLHAMNHFFSPWALLLLLFVPGIAAWRFVSFKFLLDDSPSSPADAPSGGVKRLVLAGVAAALAGWFLTAAVYWAPSGPRKQGRVMVVERHSRWEPTTKPYDTTWFVEPRLFGEGSGYNYARVYRYLGQYYEMSRLLEEHRIDKDTLKKCDVLIIKTPTERYSPSEIKAVVDFVADGGGLLLIGDHTNFERSSTILNDISRRLGFIFRDDLLFSFNPSPYEQRHVRPAVAHPAVQYVPWMDFAVSCSVDPGRSRGRTVIANTGLWSMGPEYHHENFHPIPQHCPEMRYGAFIQTWAASHGRGRVLAFTDSTIFSNFCVGQPGKTELLLGMVEWLNHAPATFNPRPWFVAVGLLLGVVALIAAWDMQCAGLILLAAGSCGWAISLPMLNAWHRWNIPQPTPLRPERCIVIDRTLSDVPLSKGPYSEGGGRGYGLLEQWFARLDAHTVRLQGAEVFSGDVLAVIYPSRSVSDEYLERLRDYVSFGGKLLVIDSPENAGSTANSLLQPFGLLMHMERTWKGRLTVSDALPQVEVARAWEVVGGRPVGRLGARCVIAEKEFDRGRVLVIGCGSLWNDKQMGETWMLEPDDATRRRYEVLFGLLRPFFEGRAIVPAEKELPPPPDSPLSEAGPAEL